MENHRNFLDFSQNREWEWVIQSILFPNKISIGYDNLQKCYFRCVKNVEGFYCSRLINGVWWTCFVPYPNRFVSYEQMIKREDINFK